MVRCRAFWECASVSGPSCSWLRAFTRNTYTCTDKDACVSLELVNNQHIHPGPGLLSYQAAPGPPQGPPELPWLEEL